jgi:hypothetical protein
MLKRDARPGILQPTLRDPMIVCRTPLSPGAMTALSFSVDGGRLDALLAGTPWGTVSEIEERSVPNLPVPHKEANQLSRFRRPVSGRRPGPPGCHCDEPTSVRRRRRALSAHASQ